MTRVGIVEPDDTVRRMLRSWIDSSPGSQCVCVCACASVKEALEEIPRCRAEVLFVDVHFPGESGIACTARLLERMPHLQIIIFTADRDWHTIYQALKAGACGYLLKTSSREEVLGAISEVREGGVPMTREIARRVVRIFQQPHSATERIKLSSRETDVLELLCEGLASKQIAAHLGISYGTVCVHLRRIYQKLRVSSRTEAAIKYSRTRSFSSALAI